METSEASRHLTAMHPTGLYDRRLLERVRPPDWPTPRPLDRYDLVVLGGGAAGLVAAHGAAGLGASVALVEAHLLGGDCLNFGCVPSKALIAGAHQGLGFAEAMERMRRLRADIAVHDSAKRLKEGGIDVFLGQARFASADTVEVDGLRLRFKRCCIATGARARVFPIPGLAEVPWVDNVGFFGLEDLPARLLVIGGGPIGCELAQAARLYGSEVTLVEAAGRILGKEEEQGSLLMRQVFTEQGITVLEGVKVQAFSEGSAARLSDGTEVAFDLCLMATGRQPNTDLDVERAGVALKEGRISVDPTLQTDNPRIFASGDCCTTVHFTHAADAMSRIVIQNAFFSPLGLGRKRFDVSLIPWVTYTRPELAGIGRREGTLLEAHFDANDRSILEGETQGWARVWVDGDRINGASIVGRHAGELLAPITQAMTMGTGMKALANTVTPYPTRSDVLRRLGGAWSRTRLTPTAASVLRTLIRWIR